MVIHQFSIQIELHPQIKNIFPRIFLYVSLWIYLSLLKEFTQMIIQVENHNLNFLYLSLYLSFILDLQYFLQILIIQYCLLIFVIIFLRINKLYRLQDLHIIILMLFFNLSLYSKIISTMNNFMDCLYFKGEYLTFLSCLIIHCYLFPQQILLLHLSNKVCVLFLQNLNLVF